MLLTAMATAVSQHVRHLGFSKKYIFSKTAANFLEISRKHVLTASNRNMIKNSVEKKKLEQTFVKKLQFSISNFNLHN